MRTAVQRRNGGESTWNQKKKTGKNHIDQLFPMRFGAFGR